MSTQNIAKNFLKKYKNKNIMCMGGGGDKNLLHPLITESYRDLVPPHQEWLLTWTVDDGKAHCPIVCPKYVFIKGPAACRGGAPDFSVLATEVALCEEV